MHEGDEPFDWDVLVPFMHPTKVLVMEALAYIGEPLSSTDLTKVLRGAKLTLSNISYHVGVLAKAEVLTLISQRRVRGSIETFYYFADS